MKRNLRLWNLRIETDEFYLLTPWFLVWASVGALRPDMLSQWSGIELHWKRTPDPTEGQMTFLREWRKDFEPIKTRESRMRFGYRSSP